AVISAPIIACYVLPSPHSLFLFFQTLHPPTSTLFPYTTLFRSAAEKLLEEAHNEFLSGHKYQTELIQSQDEQTTPSFFMIHAQDHVMTAQAELQLIKRLIDQLRMMEKLEKRVAQLE